MKKWLWKTPESEAILEEAAKFIRDGKLVVFPTETVFGLGGDGLNEQSVRKIYEVKGRPASDPVILHVASASAALELFALETDAEVQIIKRLQACHWPGPLSIVALANEKKVPMAVRAHTPYVAVRCPSHQIARSLIEKSGTPIAAPSANPFGRISPTKACHVEKYFSHCDDNEVGFVASDEACECGIESTLVRICQVGSSVKVEILREGVITLEDLIETLTPLDTSVDSSFEGEEKLFKQKFTIEYSRRKDRSLKEMIQDESEDDCDVKEGPGMFLKHYAPTVPCFMLVYGHSIQAQPIALPQSAATLLDLSGGVLEPLRDQFKIYCNALQHADEQFHGNKDVAIHTSERVHHQLNRSLFASLHHAEQLALESQCTSIFIAVHELFLDTPKFKGALDRIFRAASGKVRSISTLC